MYVCMHMCVSSTQPLSNRSFLCLRGSTDRSEGGRERREGKGRAPGIEAASTLAILPSKSGSSSGNPTDQRDQAYNSYNC